MDNPLVPRKIIRTLVNPNLDITKEMLKVQLGKVTLNNYQEE